MLAYKTFMYHQITLVSKLSPDKRAWYGDKPGIHAWKAQKEMIYGNGNNRGDGFGRNSASTSINASDSYTVILINVYETNQDLDMKKGF